PSPFMDRLTGSVVAPNTAFTIWGAGLHMHTRGTHGRIGIRRSTTSATPGADDCALQIDKWDFHWQGSYSLVQPMQFAPGDQLELECHFDNTAGNQPLVNGVPMPVRDVNWGESTTDEMCLGLFYITQ